MLQQLPRILHGQQQLNPYKVIYLPSPSLHPQLPLSANGVYALKRESLACHWLSTWITSWSYSSTRGTKVSCPPIGQPRLHANLVSQAGRDWCSMLCPCETTGLMTTNQGDLVSLHGHLQRMMLTCRVSVSVKNTSSTKTDWSGEECTMWCGRLPGFMDSLRTTCSSVPAWSSRTSATSTPQTGATWWKWPVTLRPSSTRTMTRVSSRATGRRIIRAGGHRPRGQDRRASFSSFSERDDRFVMVSAGSLLVLLQPVSLIIYILAIVNKVNK